MWAGRIFMLAAAGALVHAPAAGAQLARQTFEVNLGSGAIPGPLPFDEPFFLSAPAPDNLLQVQLWAVPERRLARDGCPQVRAPDPAVKPADRDRTKIWLTPTSTWSRAGLDSIARFDLHAGPLSPNRDYTFCFHLLRKPSAADSAAFSTRLTRNLTAALEARAALVLTDSTLLDAVQLALVDALPPADSIVFLDPTSIFMVPRGESRDARLQRLDRVLVLASDYLQFSLMRKGARAQVDDIASAKAALTAVFRNPALPQLARVYNTTIPSGLDRSRLGAAALLGARISAFTPEEAAQIAKGLASLTGSPGAGRTRDISTITTSGDLRAYRDTLLQTQAALRDIASLAALASERPGADIGTPSRAALNLLIADLSTAITEITGEIDDLTGLSAVLDEGAEAVQDLVKTVRTLDFARIALRSTTSDTYKARANTYIGLDAGLLGAQDVHRVLPYFGANLYFRPVNKNAPLGWCPCLGRRVSLTLGVTAVSVAEKDRIEDTFKGHSILTGVGVRLTDYWRISGGLLVIRTYDEDEPGELRLGAVPSWATSLDIDIVGLLGKVGTALLP
jgi:hypothetical protein